MPRSNKKNMRSKRKGTKRAGTKRMRGGDEAYFNEPETKIKVDMNFNLLVNDDKLYKNDVDDYIIYLLSSFKHRGMTDTQIKTMAKNRFTKIKPTLIDIKFGKLLSRFEAEKFENDLSTLDEFLAKQSIEPAPGSIKRPGSTGSYGFPTGSIKRTGSTGSYGFPTGSIKRPGSRDSILSNVDLNQFEYPPPEPLAPDEGGAGSKHHTYATISHFKTPGSFRKSTQRNKSPGYAKLVKRNKKSTSPTLRTLRRKNNVRDLIKKINQ